MAEYYTKDDYLPPSKFAKKYNLPFELVEKAMSYAYLHSIKVSTPRKPPRDLIIKKDKKFFHLRPEPEALAKFQEILKQFQEKGK